METTRKKHYDPNKCERRVRKGARNKRTGNSIMITGHHAHEWSVIIECECHITEITFNNRISAYAEYERRKPLIIY